MGMIQKDEHVGGVMDFRYLAKRVRGAIGSTNINRGTDCTDQGCSPRWKACLDCRLCIGRVHTRVYMLKKPYLSHNFKKKNPSS